MVAKNPYAAVWEQAEKSLRFRIEAVHDTGITVERGRDHLNWSGEAADRFRGRAHNRTQELHQHNDVLRNLLTLIRQAAEVKIPSGGAKA